MVDHLCEYTKSQWIVHFKRMNFISQNCYKNVTHFSSTVHHFLSAHSVMHCARLLGYTDEGDKHLFPPRASSLGVKGTQTIKCYHMVEGRQVLESDHLAQRWGVGEIFPEEVLISAGSSKISKSKEKKQLPFHRGGDMWVQARSWGPQPEVVDFSQVVLPVSQNSIW